MKIQVRDEIVVARLTFWPTIEYRSARDPGGVLQPEDDAALLRNAGIALVSATARERELLRRHRFRLPKSRIVATVQAPRRPRRSTARSGA